MNVTPKFPPIKIKAKTEEAKKYFLRNELRSLYVPSNTLMDIIDRIKMDIEHEMKLK